jgi:beta-galactosidase
MKKIIHLISFCIGCFVFIPANAQNKSRVNFNNNWKFELDSVQAYNAPNTQDANWRTLNLPHDWSIEGSFSKDNAATPGGGALPGGIGWYRKTFTISTEEKNKLVYITFDGVYMNSEVWINGHLLGKRPNGYISFQYDLTPYLKYGAEKNCIAVKVDNLKQPNSRWYSGSGIYRNVWLTTVNKIHVANWGTFITTPQVADKSATVNIAINIQNDFSTNKNVIVNTTLYDAVNRQVAKASAKTIIASTAAQVKNGDASSVNQSFIISNPSLWSIEKPVLYKAVTQVMVDGKIADTYETPFGIRYFSFDVNKGFFLNGKP